MPAGSALDRGVLPGRLLGQSALHQISLIASCGRHPVGGTVAL
jgi:hypothetical protein